MVRKVMVMAGLVLAAVVAAGSLLHMSGPEATPQSFPRAGLVPVVRGIVDVDGGLVQIASHRDGIVQAVLVDEGVMVLKDQPLAVINDRAAAIQLAIAESQLGERCAAAQAQGIRVAAARRERDRLVPIARSQAVSQKSLDEAESELRLAEAELVLRQAELTTAEAQRRSAAYEREVRTVRAPSDGVIVRRLVRPGDGVSTMNVTSLFWFAPAVDRIVRAEIEEQFAPLIAEGQPVEISLETNEGGVATRGRMLRVGGAFGPRRATTYEPRDRADVRVLEAIITFDGPAPQVPLGQRVIVRFLGRGQP